MEALIWFRWAVAFVIATILSLHGYKRKSLDWTGCLAAFFVGLTSLGTSYRFGALLLLFYYSSSKLTKLKEEVKSKYEEDYLLGGQRNWIQVFANSILAICLCLYYYIHLGEDHNVNFAGSSRDFHAAQISCMIVAHFACANGDTWASEVGILARPKPRLITSLFMREVPPGTNGGVSVLGTVASCLGGSFIGIIYFLFSFIYLLTDAPVSTSLSLLTLRPQLKMIAFGGVCGMMGSLIDSLLGAVFQVSYYSQEKGKIVKSADLKKDPSIIRICGNDFISNEAVNFLSIALTMIFSFYIAPYFFSSNLVN